MAWTKSAVAPVYEQVQKHKVTPGIPGWLNYGLVRQGAITWGIPVLILANIGLRGAMS